MEGLIIILVYALIALAVIGMGLLLYFRSLASRKRYACPQCGEVQTVELMHATHCNTCGAAFTSSPR